MEKQLLLGDEALALAAINAGISGVYAYPGTPSTEITEYIQNYVASTGAKIHCRWSSNEKTAMEAALGMSYAGKRALVCMKHVGMNVCADAFVNSAVTGVNGGLVVVAADDPSMHSSQNEQDSRFYGKFAIMPIFEPSNQQEVYDIVSDAFNLSEELSTPVLLRMVTHLSHSRAGVQAYPIEKKAPKAPVDKKDKSWVLLPGIAKRQYAKLLEKEKQYKALSEKSAYNVVESKGKAPLGVIACGIAYNFVKECAPQLPVLKISQYPLPEEKIKAFLAANDKVMVFEDGQPVVEEAIKAFADTDKAILGRLTGDLPRTGELDPDNVAAALGLKSTQVYQKAKNLAPRPPQLCPGCGHRDVYNAINAVAAEYENARVFGDIGCYTLGALPPFSAINSCVDMGASITMAKGAADSGVWPSIAIIGDSTFTHSGMTGLLDAANENSDITVIISDNLTTAMTGGQQSAGTSKFEAICLGLGVSPEHCKVVVPTPANMEAITKTIREEISYHGLSVIIPRRECMQTLKRHAKK